jgi:capsular exopolysaccharide synthesis family protein
MTTLPTTTPIRLPRPAGGPGMLALPGAGVGAAAQGSGFQMSGADVWRVIRSNMWLIIVLLILSGIAGEGAYRLLMKYFRSYTAIGYVQVNPQMNPDIMVGGYVNQDVNALAMDQRTQAALLRTDALFLEVLSDRNADIQKTAWAQSFRDASGNLDIYKAKEDLEDDFRADAVPEQKLIAVSMSDADPKSARTIVMDIVNRHLDDQIQQSSLKQQDQVRMLKNLEQTYIRQRDDDRRKRDDRAAQLSLDGMGVSGRLSTRDIELQNLLREASELAHNRDEAAGDLKAATAQVNEGAELPLVQEAISRDTYVTDLQRALMQTDMSLAAVSSQGQNSRQFRSIQSQHDDLQKKLEDAIASVRAKKTAAVLEQLRQQKETTQSQYDAIEERVKAAKEDLGQLTNAMSEYLTAKDDEETVRELLQHVSEKLDKLQQVGGQDISTVQWAKQPPTPDIPSFPKRPWTIAAAMVAGLLLALGIAFARELLDTSVRSPRDIARVGQLNLLGIIPHEDDDPQAAGAPLPMVIFQAPHSMLAEQLRQVRSRLAHATSLDSTRSIMITSPSPQDGKTIVACNLAAGLALNGRRILLVDANFRRPELHKIFNLPGNAGFADALQSPETFAQAVCQTEVPNLDVLPAGTRPSNATELVESQLLIDFIERALEEYDHVIFDTGPFVFASESVALAPRVDGVITVVRARQSSRGLLQRMRDDLRKSKAEHLGVVLNAVRAQAGGYYNRNIKTYYAYQNGHEG